MRYATGRVIVTLAFASVINAFLVTSAPEAAAQPKSVPATRNGQQVYQAACASCHGVDGKGVSRPMVGFRTPLPDFTTCTIATKVADVKWRVIVREGGPARSLNRMMPAFGRELSGPEIYAVIDYVRKFCTKTSRASDGGLDLPKPLVISKPVPQNQAVLPSSGALRSRALFATSDACMACHNGELSSGSRDKIASFGSSWRSTMMANSSRDPYWQASVRREILAHPTAASDIEDACAACHMPMSRTQAKADGGKGSVFSNLFSGANDHPQASLAIDGVSCTLCHQIAARRLGTADSYNGGFVVNTKQRWDQRPAFGPYAITRGLTRVMQSASAFQPVQSEHVQQAERCASCHTLFTEALDAQGKVVGKLPEQVPYLEWKQSDYSAQMSCQECHMPSETEPVRMSSVLGQPRDRLRRHVFIGGNFLIPRMLNRFRTRYGVQALPQEIDAAYTRTIDHLRQAAAGVTIENAKFEANVFTVDVVVSNLAGHKLPTAYPSRRAWLHIVITGEKGVVLFESGALNPDGSIQGNDNDQNATRFEPHRAKIDSRDKVQIYESIMVDAAGEVTTELLRATRYIKDNRILPVGFDKTKANGDIAPRGQAADDPAFSDAGHRVTYKASVRIQPKTICVTAELFYQPIGYRWAMNLRAVSGDEPERFVQYFTTEKTLASVLARATSQWSPSTSR
jgi:mono/diheme cytochrome c family protein